MADFLSGGFLAYEPGGYPNGPRRVIPFRFNPESLSRSLSIEAAQATQGVEGAQRGASSTNEQSADASSGTLKETFSVQVRLDLVDRLEAAVPVNLDARLGILPEISALEDLLYPADTPTTANSDGKEPTLAHAQRPTVLVFWGNNRIFPVKITQMTINETLHNQALNPIRAEVDVTMEVLREGDAANNAAVREALLVTGNTRRSLAGRFLDTTATQQTSIPRF